MTSPSSVLTANNKQLLFFLLYSLDVTHFDSRYNIAYAFAIQRFSFFCFFLNTTLCFQGKVGRRGKRGIMGEPGPQVITDSNDK